jgi:hypothetical protein
LYAVAGHFFAVQRVRQLDQDAGAVAHQLVSAHCAPMVQIFENFQTLLNNRMAFMPLDVGHKTDATGIVLVRTGVQTVFFKMLDFSSRGHGIFLVGWG